MAIDEEGTNKQNDSAISLNKTERRYDKILIK